MAVLAFSTIKNNVVNYQGILSMILGTNGIKQYCVTLECRKCFIILAPGIIKRYGISQCELVLLYTSINQTSKKIYSIGPVVQKVRSVIIGIYKFHFYLWKYFQGLGKIMSLLSVTFCPIFIAINRKNSGNSFVTLYVQRDLN